jgi:hypothetical protein
MTLHKLDYGDLLCVDLLYCFIMPISLLYYSTHLVWAKIAFDSGRAQQLVTPNPVEFHNFLR